MTEEVTKEVGDLFKGLGLNQESGQKLMEFYAAKTQEAVEAPYKLWNETQKKWQDEVKADPDLGKDLSGVKTTISRAINGLGDAKLASDFRAAMDLTGAGNHPAFIKAFYKLAQKVTEGRPATGGGPSAAGQKGPDERPLTAAGAMYPNLPS